MASSLNIIGNHKIDFNSGEHVIEQIEDMLEIKVQNGTYASLNNIDQSSNESEIELFCSYDHLEHNLKNHNMVKIMSTNKACYELIILEKTILLFTNLLIKYWKPLLLNEASDISRTTQYEHTRKNWKMLEPYAKQLIQKVGGSQLLFISDDYEIITDKCYEGKTEYRNLIDELVKDFSKTQLNWIKGNNLRNRLRFNWLNLSMNTAGTWDLDTNQHLKNDM